MGCLVGIVAGAVALIGGYLVGGWSAGWAGENAALVGLIFGLLALAVGFFIVFAFGHRSFGSGQRTDLPLFVAGVGVVFALIVPRWSSSREKIYVETMRSDLGELILLQDRYRADHGTFATTLDEVGFTPSPGVGILLGDTGEGGWAASATHAGTLVVCTYSAAAEISDDSTTVAADSVGVTCRE